MKRLVSNQLAALMVITLLGSAGARAAFFDTSVDVFKKDADDEQAKQEGDRAKRITEANADSARAGTASSANAAAIAAAKKEYDDLQLEIDRIRIEEQALDKQISGGAGGTAEQKKAAAEWDGRSGWDKFWSFKPDQVKALEHRKEALVIEKAALAVKRDKIDRIGQAASAAFGREKAAIAQSNALVVAAQSAQAAAQTAGSTPEIDKSAGALKAAEVFYQKQKEQGYEAKFLMMDFKLLETKAGLKQEHIEGLIAKVDGQLNNTLLGAYINKQIKKGAQAPDCKAVKACSSNGPLVNIDQIPRETSNDAPKQSGSAGDGEAGRSASAAGAP